MDHIFENEGKPVPDPNAVAESSNPSTTAQPMNEDDEDDLAAFQVSKVLLRLQLRTLQRLKLKPKIFKNTALANYHTEKSGHDQFEESTEEVRAHSSTQYGHPPALGALRGAGWKLSVGDDHHAHPLPSYSMHLVFMHHVYHLAYGWLLPSTCIHQPEIYDIEEHTPHLLSLPDELLVDILVQLNCSTIFQARALEQDLAPPEQDISRYGIRELERWAWRRTTALSRATARPLVQPHVRLLKIEDDDELYLAEPYLLPGGRWLLLAHPVLGMLLYDLDHVEPTHVTRTLIYAVWLEGKGPESTLTASLVAPSCSPGRSVCYHEEFAFNKNYYIQISGVPLDSRYQHVKAYQLEKAPNSSYHRLAKPVAQITIPDDWGRLTSFIYDDVLAIFAGDGTLKLFAIVRRGTVTDTSFTGSFELLHEISLSFNFNSTIRWSLSKSCMVAMTSEGIFYGLQIPHDKTIAPTVQMLDKRDTPPNKVARWVADKSFSVSLNVSRASLEVIYHPWTNVGGDLSLLKGSLDGFKIRDGLGLGAYVAGFSEDLGRLAIFEVGRQTHLLVYDLVGPPFFAE
ncbi:hypothetical protein NP233_g11972 [Leucocoprinus birnbaumii]|uniref:F-box domain-containing protein n=1 Tax=Leucocoprinus birnbaumii TaxID=56174 RepID=A0AAD5VFY7_9AGAR|nr:hypothetical protein NP233_g11972 [Leucocoprinus birnbaumii]